MSDPLTSRFLTIPDVAEELATSPAQIRALIKRRELPALQIGGRGQWRIERAKLEDYIQAAYEATDASSRSGVVDLRMSLPTPIRTTSRPTRTRTFGRRRAAKRDICGPSRR